MSITPIPNPLPGERVVALSPETAVEAATVWLARPNVFAGRALTAPTLQRRQRWQSGHLALRGQAVSAGVVRGLEVGHELVPGETEGDPVRVRLTIAAGLGLSVSGEDVTLARRVQIDLSQLPVYAEPSAEPDGPAAPDDAGGNTDADLDAPFAADSDVPLRARAILDSNLGSLFAAAPNAIAHVGILVLQPVTVDRIGEFDPTDPCEYTSFGEAGDNSSFEDWRIADAVRVVWHAWPTEWHDVPAAGATLRNDVAWTIFHAESVLAPDRVLPWEELGVPIAVIALDDNLQPLFIDRASVVRLGGRTRNPRLRVGSPRLTAHSRQAFLWQAQIEQFAEQLAAAGDPPPNAATLAQQFSRLPPAGLLPTHAIDLDVLPLNQATERLASEFFPGAFELDAVPIPLESLDLAIREAAPLTRLNMHQAERVRVLVPVPQAVYEPRLLHEEVIDPEFQTTLDRFLLARARALGARQGLRTKISELVRLSSGRAVTVPDLASDAAALEAESLEPWGPPPAQGGHRSTLTAGFHQHLFTAATATLTAADGESFYAWVYLDPDQPPRALMLQWNVADSWEHRAYWSADEDRGLLALGTDESESRRRIGELPETGRWTRVEIQAAAVGLAGAVITGMAFTLYDGRAAYGATGRVDAATANDVIWFASAAPAGATLTAEGAGTEAWTFLTPNDLFAPFEPALGLEVNSDSIIGRRADIVALLADPSLALVTTANGVVTGALSETERGQLGVRGLEGFIAMLKSRADRADDLIDYGFVKVQTDTYRMRQLILGTTAATRLAVSPALATIAQAETAVASQERISTFFDELKASTTPAPTAAGPSPLIGIRASDSVLSASSIATTPTGTISRTLARRTAAPIAGLSILSADRARESTLGGGFGGGLVFSDTAASTTLNRDVALEQISGVQFNSRQDAIDVNLGNRFVGGAATTFTPIDVVGVDPLIGKANIRTTSIAQRLEQPKALETKDYSTSTRHDAVQALLRLADELRAEDNNVTPGLFEGINVYGLENDPFLPPPPANGTQLRFRPFANFITTRTLASDLLRVPDREGDEAAHFSDSADLADNTIAFIRQVEGRVKVYRDAVVACERVLQNLRNDISGASTVLAAWEERVAEARHDVGVTRALMAEEEERLAAINARRTAVLRNEVRFLAYIRPREAHNLVTTPLRTLNPGLLEAPVPACLAAHADMPDELNAILSVLREAPVAWFINVPKLMERLDRKDLLIRTLQSAQLRSQVFTLKSAAVSLPSATTAVRKAIGLVQARQQQTIAATRRVATTFNIAQLSTLTWQGVRPQVEQVISLGDLVDGEHGRGDVAREAARIFDEMSRITACLHAEFSTVLPSIRLDWAERLSQFDQAPSLRDLSALARWTEIPYEDRRQLQGFVDWLFDQIDARVAAAEGLMNDVVRMCLLLAADAPIGRIVAGRLPRPVVARPGIRIPLTVFDPSRVRLGMHALVYRGSDVVARAVVEDIGSEISARVIQTQTAEVSLGVESRVQFAEAATVSLAATANAYKLRA